MQIQSAVFVTSAACPDQFLKRPIPHIVFAGKSNVGKSSVLNRLLNRKNLAKTSQTPGKTRLINYFLVNDRFFFVDIPGYGYAKVSKKERQQWTHLIETFFQESAYISLIFQLIDIRHDPSTLDLTMISWLKHYRFPFRILLTKADKLSKSKVRSQQTSIARALELEPSELLPTSAITSQGMDQAWRHINQAYEATRNLYHKRMN